MFVAKLIKHLIMDTVFKYELKTQDFTDVSLPVGAKPLRVDMQMGRIFLWAFVDTTAPLENRTFAIMGTGESFRANEGKEYHYINTFFDNNEAWHAFEITY